MNTNENSHEIIKHNIGETIFRKRNLMHLTQQQLAEKSCLSKNYISSLENGHENPTLDALINVSTGLELSFRDFVVEAFSLNHADIDQKILPLITYYNRLSDAQKRIIDSIIHEFI